MTHGADMAVWGVLRALSFRLRRASMCVCQWRNEENRELAGEPYIMHGEWLEQCLLARFDSRT